MNFFLFGVRRLRGTIPFICVNPVRLHRRRPMTITALKIHNRSVRAATNGLHVNGMIQFEGAWIIRSVAQRGELRVPVFESPNVRGIVRRSGFRFQIRVTFAAGPIAYRAYVYATAMLAVTHGAFRSFDLIVVMDRAVVTA